MLQKYVSKHQNRKKPTLNLRIQKIFYLCVIMITKQLLTASSMPQSKRFVIDRACPGIWCDLI
jgi:hypothetical protein